jgi:hypothetical protein
MSKHLALLLVLAIFVASCGQGYVERTKQFSKQVKSVVNPDELQAWATNVILTTPAKNGDTSVNPKATGIPKGLLGLSGYPPDVWIARSDGEAYVVICYGSGMGHIGLYVGDKSFRTESDQQIYVVPWQPGVYFCDGP